MSDEFGYEEMLKIGKPFKADPERLDQLAESMTQERQRIPAGYVFLGQFIDHDVTMLRVNGKSSDPFGGEVDLKTVANFRTPFLNLETIYGFEIAKSEAEPSRRDLLEDESEAILRIGKTIAFGRVKEEFADQDLPRKPGSKEALLVDPRNDENLAVAQTHVMFIRFHNAVVRRHLNDDEKDPNTFKKARKIVIQHYQWIVLHDFLEKILKPSVLADVLTSGNQFYFPDKKRPYIPLEFSVGAFRLGHSMIASNYNWNRLFNDEPFSDRLGTATLMDLQRFTTKGEMNNQTRLPSDWVINWKWFHRVGNRQGQKLNLAERITTKLARFTMPTERYERQFSLAAMDLFRTGIHSLPTGQAVARAISGSDDRVLEPEQIANLLPQSLKSVFSKETPLWFYLLAEAEIEEQGYTFGEIGSRIMAEVFVELIKLSEYSILQDGFLPNRDWSDAFGRFGMPELIRFVTSNQEAELDPLSTVKF